MKKLALSIVAILGLLFLLDRAGGLLMGTAYQHSRDVWSYKINHIARQVNAPVVLLGTSRCNNHYVPSVIADSLGTEVYNAGISSTKNIYSHYICLCHLLRRYTPRVVCLELSAADFAQEDDAFSSTAFFAPLFGLDEQADSVLRDAGRYWAFRLSHLYRFNGRALQTLAGLILDWQKDDEQGYLPIEKPASWPDPLYEEQAVPEVDSLKIAYLNRFVARCRERHIGVVFVISPKFTIAPAGYYAPLQEVARQNGIPLLDYHSAGLYHNRPELFHDNDHLWDEGARLYSARFAADLRRVLDGSVFNPNR